DHMTGPTTASGPRRGRRVAAIVAIGSLAVAIVVVGVSALEHLVPVLANVACLALLGLAGWFAVSRSGWVRAGAVVVAVGSLGGAGVLVFPVDLAWWRLVVSLVAVATSIGAARLALLEPASSAATAVPALTPAARPVLLMNPRSGGGKVERFDLVAECR